MVNTLNRLIELEFNSNHLIIISASRVYLQSGGRNAQLIYNQKQLERVGLAQTGFIMTNRPSLAGRCLRLCSQKLVPDTFNGDVTVQIVAPLNFDVPLTFNALGFFN